MAESFGTGGIKFVHSWSRTTAVACEACRDKKRRCDRMQPCSNCKLRDFDCIYRDPPEGKNYNYKSRITYRAMSMDRTANLPRRVPRSASHYAQSLNTFRVGPPKTETSELIQAHQTTHSTSEENNHTYVPSIISKLPPVSQGRLLFKNFVANVHCYFGVLHIPATQGLLEYTYEQMNRQQQPNLEDVLLLFVMFSGSLAHINPELLDQLNMSKEQADAASAEYEMLATGLLDNSVQPVTQSTTVLSAISTLGNIQINQQGPAAKCLTMRVKCLVMARMMGIDKLDSQKQKKHRSEHGYNAIELEVQRRIWWNLVASDWLSSFAGGTNEGSYMIQARHMKVDYPQNVNDDQISKDGVEQRYLPCGYSDMSGFLERVRLATICREVVDALPSPYLHEEEPPDYALILQQHDRFQRYMDSLPIYYRTDSASIYQCHQLCQDHPIVVLQRLSAHFSCQMRISRLHRPYHLEGFTNAKYAKSREACVTAASTVLHLRGQMEQLGPKLGIYPARSWIFMQHVFVAALMLALEFSYNPDAPDAAERKAKVLAACHTLERVREEAGPIMIGVKKNIETLMSTLNEKNNADLARKRNGNESDSRPEGHWKDIMLENPAPVQPLEQESTQDWHELFDQFLNAAPGLDSLQWDFLLDDLNDSVFPV